MKKTTLSCMIFLVACLCYSIGQAPDGTSLVTKTNKELSDQLTALMAQFIPLDEHLVRQNKTIGQQLIDMEDIEQKQKNGIFTDAISTLLDEAGIQHNRIVDLEKLFNKQENERQELKDATNDLENTVTQQQKELDEQKDTMEDLEKIAKEPINATEDLKDTVTQQQKELEEQKDTTTQQQKELEKQKDNTKDLENTVTQQQKELEKQNNITKDLENTVPLQQKEFEKQKNTNGFIRYIFTVQQTYLMKQIDDIDVRNDIVTQQQKELEEQKDTIEDLEKKVKEQNTSTDDLKDTVTQQQKELEKQKDTTKDLENTDTQQEKELQEIKDKRLRESYTCAFSYSTKAGDGDGARNTIVKFSVKVINIDNRYDSTTGVFTASKRGIYVFHLTILADGNGLIKTILWKNDEYVAKVHTFDSIKRDQSANSVTLFLEPGDRIYPKMAYYNGGKLLDFWHRLSMFSGYLLKRL